MKIIPNHLESMKLDAAGSNIDFPASWGRFVAPTGGGDGVEKHFFCSPPTRGARTHATCFWAGRHAPIAHQLMAIGMPPDIC